MSKIEDWEKFSALMEEHIEASGKKYDIGNVSCVDIDPWISCISNARKYLWEIMSWFNQESWDINEVRINLLKAAHYLQIAYTKLDVALELNARDAAIEDLKVHINDTLHKRVEIKKQKEQNKKNELDNMTYGKIV